MLRGNGLNQRNVPAVRFGRYVGGASALPDARCGSCRGALGGGTCVSNARALHRDRRDCGGSSYPPSSVFARPRCWPA